MDFRRVYFIGIGGIGMSAIARFFMHEGKPVAGYDLTESRLTKELEAEGADIHYRDDVALIPEEYLNRETTLVVYTPAIDDDHTEFRYFSDNGFEVVKRSAMLGVISKDKYVMAVSGTHGKTTTSTMAAWFNHIAGVDGADGRPAGIGGTGAAEDGSGKRGASIGGGSAFLGGISKDFDSNLVLGRGDRLVVEADEFDRSFHQLYPDIAVVTSVDPDHLDIYGTFGAVKEAFEKFISQIKPDGAVIIKSGVDIHIPNRKIRAFSYALEDRSADFFAENITLLGDGRYKFDIFCPDKTIKDCVLGLPGRVNVENCIAAVAMLWVAGYDEDKLREAIASFSGVRRRMDFWLNTPRHIYIDDYAHHPAELTAAISSVRAMFPSRKLTAVFQPHLYTRTRDFYKEFAAALSAADEVFLLPIYPAREEPIEGVTSKLILDSMGCKGEIVEKEELTDVIGRERPELLVTFGAGDIDRLCAGIADVLKE